MIHAEFRELCLSFPASDNHFPFDQETEVFRLHGKMFALCNINQSNGPITANLKCDPDLAVELRKLYPGDVRPGFHMNKRHWNTVIINGTIPDERIVWMVGHSRDCVKAGLPKRLQVLC